MRILSITDNYRTPDGAFFHIADSALLRDGKPFFIPDFATECTVELHLVVRLSRLGRSIAPRFASRYYDAVSIGAAFVAENLLYKLKKSALPWEMSRSFDGAACVGKFVSLEGRNVQDLRFRLDLDGQTVQMGFSGDMLHTVDELIAQSSRYFMVRQGDFLFTGCPALPTPVSTDSHIDGWLGDEKVLSFNVK